MKRLIILVILVLTAGQIVAQYDVNSLYIRIQNGESREVARELNPLLKDSLFRDPLVLTLLGDSWRNQFEYSQALQAYKRVLQIDSSNLRAMESASDMYSMLGETGSSKQLLVKLSKIDTSNIRFLNKLAQTMQSQQDTREAVNIYKRLMRLGGSGYNTVKSLADCYWLLGKRDSAEVYYKVADIVNGKSVATKLNLSQIAYINKDLSSARIYALRGVELDSTYLPLRKQLGMVHYRLEEYNSALNNFNYLIFKGDSTAATLKYAGACNFFLGNFGESVPLLKSVLERDSSDTEAMFYLGSSLSHKGDSQEAINVFNEIMDLIQPDPVLLYKLYNQLGIAYSALEKLQLSYDSFAEAYRLNPGDNKLIFQMAMVRGGFKDKGSLTEAKSLLEKYLESIAGKGSNLSAEEVILRERAKMYIERISEELFMNE